ncbi:hypothetical protein A0O34_17595 [Chryseobacterium glaciei]|uniref:DUF7822 domain-containing protein n=1 Tax=Chryseobacterium glaciei TaxID=1685010 RepID=A0A172XYX1_9FLAO|nr:hypothetical protein [Chryseobacterium glaciei]ANF52219.1 hypothetical protein A0O34_17595 [Chryseobacterium glaciei]
MANRSFIYTTDDYQQNPIKALGFSEYENEVHPLYLLMVAGESQMISSTVVEEIEKTAIVGNFDQGKELVLKFLELVSIYEEAYQIDSFKDFVKETKEILNQRKVKYVILENFEIVELSGNNFVSDTFQGLSEIKQEIEELYAKHLNGNLCAENIRESEFYNDFDDTSIEWGEIDRDDIDWTNFWSENLYYNLQK